MKSPDTTRTEVTAEQKREGVSPETDDASARAEEAVASEPAPAATIRRRARQGEAPEEDGQEAPGQSLEDRVAALESDLRQLRLQLRHMV